MPFCMPSPRQSDDKIARLFKLQEVSVVTSWTSFVSALELFCEKVCAKPTMTTKGITLPKNVHRLDFYTDVPIPSIKESFARIFKSFFSELVETRALTSTPMLQYLKVPDGLVGDDAEWFGDRVGKLEVVKVV